jgi:hypothetical protein
MAEGYEKSSKINPCLLLAFFESQDEIPFKGGRFVTP